MVIFGQASLNAALEESKSIFERVSDSLFNAESILVFVLAIVSALLAGRLIAALLRKVTKFLGNRADKSEDLDAVMRYRRLETYIVLSIAVIRAILVLFALYFWWVFTHAGQQPTALLGAGAVLTLVLSGAMFNTLRDVASGAVMMAEHWYGVGDHIKVEPFPDAQGIVERVTLRSTRIRKFSGEVLWVNNKDIAGITVTPKGVRTVAIELFAKDGDLAAKLIEDANLRLPMGPLAVARPLSIMTQTAVGKNLWHITAISEVAPGREWLLDDFATEVIQELDEKHKTLVHDPITRAADSEAERRFARTILNARKERGQHISVRSRVEKAAHLGQRANGKSPKPTSKHHD
jgi:hypothetical protein